MVVPSQGMLKTSHQSPTVGRTAITYLQFSERVPEPVKKNKQIPKRTLACLRGTRELKRESKQVANSPHLDREGTGQGSGDKYWEMSPGQSYTGVSPSWNAQEGVSLSDLTK